jgi:hypothetical protein
MSKAAHGRLRAMSQTMHGQAHRRRSRQWRTMSLREIAAELNNRGIPTLAQWRAAQVCRLLARMECGAGCWVVRPSMWAGNA